MKRVCSLFVIFNMIFCLAACEESAEARWQEQYDLGVRYLSEGNYEEAIIAFTAAIEIDPKRPEAYLRLADVHIEQGHFDDAKTILETGYEVTADEDIKERLNRLGEEQSSEGNPNTIISEEWNSSIQAEGNQLMLSLNVPDLKKNYAVNREDTPVNGCDCQWMVQFTDGKNQYEVGTSHWKFEESQMESISLYEMQSDVWIINSDERIASRIASANLEIVGTTLWWSFVIPEEYEFDAANMQITGSVVESK